MLNKHKHPHTFIYLRVMQEQYLDYMIDFMYSGETYVPKDDIDHFLALANEFKIK